MSHKRILSFLSSHNTNFLIIIIIIITTKHSVLSCSMLILRILQLLQYIGMTIDSAYGDIYRRPSHVKHSFWGTLIIIPQSQCVNGESV